MFSVVIGNFKIYWALYIPVLCLCIYLVYKWDKIMSTVLDNESPWDIYGVMLVVCVYLCIGPLGNLINIVPELKLAKEYREYKQEVIIPTEVQYHNAEIPDGFYYLGVEIVEFNAYVHDEECWYVYTFGTVDYEEHENCYMYETTELLDPDVPYLLVMDSLATDTLEDDCISVVWKCVD